MQQTKSVSNLLAQLRMYGSNIHERLNANLLNESYGSGDEETCSGNVVIRLKC